MLTIQHRDARKLLRLISAAMASGTQLTYTSAAEALGRRPPAKHGKAVAQTCDLLDAAACLAGVPLLALVKVREISGKINPKAFRREFGARRDAIIERSLNHTFTEKDLRKIASALDELGERGNTRAWALLWTLSSEDEIYRRLTGVLSPSNSNAMDDLGTDIPDRRRAEYWSYDRDPRVREAVLRRADGQCEYCGAAGFLRSDGSRFLETHHVIALANEGEDRLTNVIALCPNDHREAHFGKRAPALEGEMIAKLRALTSQVEKSVSATTGRD